MNLHTWLSIQLLRSLQDTHPEQPQVAIAKFFEDGELGAFSEEEVQTLIDWIDSGNYDWYVYPNYLSTTGLNPYEYVGANYDGTSKLSITYEETVEGKQVIFEILLDGSTNVVIEEVGLHVNPFVMVITAYGI